MKCIFFSLFIFLELSAVITVKPLLPLESLSYFLPQDIKFSFQIIIFFLSFPFSVTFVGLIFSTRSLNIEPLSGLILYPFSPLILYFLYTDSSILRRLTFCLLSQVQIRPLGFRYIDSGLLDNSKSVSQRHLEIIVHKIKFMIYLYKT